MINIKSFLINTIILSFFAPCVFAADSITMTTYYPAPNGDYSNLQTQNFTVFKTATIQGPLYVNNTNNTDTNAGKVGIGVTSGTLAEKLVVKDGNITVSGTPPGTGHVDALAFYYVSDKRLKENIVPVPDGLEKVLALRGVSFNFKNSPGQKRIGLIAQEVEAVVPQVVLTGKDGFKSVEYGNLVALLIEAVKAQQKEIDVLKKDLESLKSAGK